MFSIFLGLSLLSQLPSPSLKKRGFIFYQKQLVPQFHLEKRIHLALVKIIYKNIPKISFTPLLPHSEANFGSSLNRY